MAKTAVILAAGLGSRLKHLTKETPKGLIEVAGKSLIERSLAALKAAGVEQVFVGTGYLSEIYDDVFKARAYIKCVKSEKFAISGSMYTLHNMREFIKGDFLLLESDLLYDPKGLELLLKDRAPDVVLGSGKTNSGDEVYIETDDRGMLVNMSKKPDQLGRIDAELVGITKISKECFVDLCRYSESVFEAGNLKLDYEYALVQVGKSRPIKVLKIDDLAWCEVDDQDHLARAQNIIFPRIESRAS